jgi:hypothetical protein
MLCSAVASSSALLRTYRRRTLALQRHRGPLVRHVAASDVLASHGGDMVLRKNEERVDDERVIAGRGAA